MKSTFYSQTPPPSAPATPRQLPDASRLHRIRPEGYLPDPGLVDAVNVALLLAQPLLLTGEPGTGKTQLAYSLAWQLGFGEPLKFETKSNSTARDLFYVYNALGRFHAAHSGTGSANALDYISYNAFGQAILLAQEQFAVSEYLPPDFHHNGPRRSVVLIDEVDKAPRDFPNDILNEIEGMYFRIPEMNNVRIGADPGMRPVVVITSNSEKQLPDAFLRRCVYFNLPFPKEEELRGILAARLGETGDADGEFLADAIALFFALREPAAGLRKPPATAELLNWVATLRNMFPESVNPLRSSEQAALRTISTLVKTAEDRPAAEQIMAGFRK
jgi:MoxR-like ATPase